MLFSRYRLFCSRFHCSSSNSVCNGSPATHTQADVGGTWVSGVSCNQQSSTVAPKHSTAFCVQWVLHSGQQVADLHAWVGFGPLVSCCARRSVLQEYVWCRPPHVSFSSHWRTSTASSSTYNCLGLLLGLVVTAKNVRLQASVEHEELCITLKCVSTHKVSPPPTRSTWRWAESKQSRECI